MEEVKFVNEEQEIDVDLTTLTPLMEQISLEEILRLIEEKVDEGLTDKLLYGTMAPYLDPGQAIGPLVLADIPWQDKCAIAGNNLRRILGEKAINPAEMKTPVIPQIIIDAHSHTADGTTKRKFPFSHVAEVWSDWKEKMVFFGSDIMLMTPSNTTRDVEADPAWAKRQYCEDSNGHIFYFEGYDPRKVEVSVANLEKSLPDPLCIGIKIHPPAHLTDADAPEYEKVYQLASKYGKPIMTHSWGESYYNATQIHSTAEKFDKYLTAYPDVKFVFGHTGGRPNGFVLAAEMINKHPNTMGDLAGDLFHNGFIDHAIKEIGADRIMFGSDIYWIDPRCMLGMLLAADISDEDLLKILRLNAEKFYLGK